MCSSKKDSDVTERRPAKMGAERPAKKQTLKCKKEPEDSFLRCVGAGKRVRTVDLYLGKVSLYQLSYSRKKPA